MTQESLDIASELVFNAIEKSNIPLLDKYELLKNLRELLLDLDTYEKDIKALQKSRKER